VSGRSLDQAIQPGVEVTAADPDVPVGQLVEPGSLPSRPEAVEGGSAHPDGVEDFWELEQVAVDHGDLPFADDAPR
jgi:hypothetical protein